MVIGGAAVKTMSTSVPTAAFVVASHSLIAIWVLLDVVQSIETSLESPQPLVPISLALPFAAQETVPAEVPAFQHK